MYSYDTNIESPDAELTITGQTLLSKAVTRVKVRKLLFDSSHKPLATLVFESDTLLIEAETLETILDLPACIRWAHGHGPHAPEPSPQPPSPSWPAPDSEDGAHGFAGKLGIRGIDGIPGRHGPRLTLNVGTANGALVIDLRGEDGQPGGAGGRGGDGQNGHRGTPGEALYVVFPPYAECKRGGGHGGNGGQGGDGGDGGSGGSGGNGGNLTLNMKQPNSSGFHLNCILDGGRGGEGGRGGGGGSGGVAGKGGRGDGPFNICNDESENRKGSPGVRGHDGRAGSHGHDGTQGTVTTSSASAAVDTRQFMPNIAASGDPVADRIARLTEICKLLSKVGSNVIRIGLPVMLFLLAIPWSLLRPAYAQESALKGQRGAVASAESSLVAPSSSVRSVDMSLPVAIGQGYYSVLGELRGNALVDSSEGPVQVSPGGGKGALTQYTVRYLRNSTELRRALNINAAVDVSYGLFSADAKANLYKSHSENANSSYLLVDYKVTHSVRRLFRFEMTPEARALAEADPAAFVRCYGNQFVAGMTTGGELVGLIEFKFTNSEERDTFSGSFAASYGPFVSGKVDAKTDVFKNDKAVSVSASVLRTGGSKPITLFKGAGDPIEGASPIASFIKTVNDRLLDQAEGFQNEVNENPVLLSVSTMDYNACGSLGKGVLSGVRPAIPTLALLQDWVEQVVALSGQAESKYQGADSPVPWVKGLIFRKVLDPLGTERELADWYVRKRVVVQQSNSQLENTVNVDKDSCEGIMKELASLLSNGKK